LREFVTQLEAKGLAPASVRKAFAPVRALFATAVEDGLIRSNPASGVRIASRRMVDVSIDADDEHVKALTADELRRLLAAIRCEKHTRKAGTCSNCDAWELFVRFLAETGLRIGEAVEVRYADIEGEGWLRVRRSYARGRIGRPKSGRIRRIRLTETMTTALDTRRRSTWAGAEDLVFCTTRGVRVNGHNFALRILRPAAKTAKIGEWVTPHVFRHTTATLLFREGWNAVQVQRFLGHSDPGFTLRTYVHLLPEDLPSTDFLAGLTTSRGNEGATQPTETHRTLTAVKATRAA
jgi:integrase